jgi:hypothetical protein
MVEVGGYGDICINKKQMIMQTTVNITTQWAEGTSAPKKASLLDKWAAIEDTQAKNITFWFLLSMMVQGLFFLPVPALLIYNFHAPVVILFVTLGLFFANIIAGMAGLGIRAILSLFVVSFIAHLLMIALVVI